MAINGNTYKMYLTTTKGAGTFTWVAGETSSNLSLSRNMIETSDKSSSAATFIAGRSSGTASVTVNLDKNATDSQRKMVNSFHSGEKLFCFQGEVGADNAPVQGTAFEALISSIDREYADDSNVTANFSLQITGSVVEYPTATATESES